MIFPVYGILKAIFKTYVKAIRYQRLSRMAFQQTQVDVFAFQLRMPAGMPSDERTALDTLLDMVLSSAMDRCVTSDPQMEPYDVEQLCRRAMTVV